MTKDEIYKTIGNSIGLIVSEPVKVSVEIEDTTTGCTYVYKGNTIIDCVKYYQSLFFRRRPYKIIRSMLIK